jgi:3-phosphoshikimate 1-carboxyvinyltransferase
MSEWKVRAGGRLDGEARVPGDKSIGHRAVLFAGIADGRSRIAGLSGGQDNQRTVAALAALGVTIAPAGDRLVVDGVGLDGLRAATAPIDCGNSGTTIRLLSGLLCGRAFESTLVGDQYLHARPMRRVQKPLALMGGRVDGQPGKKAGEIYPPLVVGGVSARLRGAEIDSDVASAQVKTAVLLAGLGADGVTRYQEPVRTRDHTERMLAAMGAPLTVGDDGVSLDPRGWDRRLAAVDFVVPGDLSSSAFLLAAATIVPGSRVVVRGVGVNPTRTGFLDALAAMGGRCTIESPRLEGGEPVGDLVAEHAPLHGAAIGGALAIRSIDELPLLGALAAHADGETVISDAAELRVKESDRIAATCAMLRALGADCEERPDGFVVRGRARRAGTVDSEGDHRIAMAGAICALGVAGETRIRDVGNVDTSFPGFAALLTSLGASVEKS